MSGSPRRTPTRARPSAPRRTRPLPLSAPRIPTGTTGTPLRPASRTASSPNSPSPPSAVGGPSGKTSTVPPSRSRSASRSSRAAGIGAATTVARIRRDQGSWASTRRAAAAIGWLAISSSPPSGSRAGSPPSARSPRGLARLPTAETTVAGVGSGPAASLAAGSGAGWPGPDHPRTPDTLRRSARSRGQSRGRRAPPRAQRASWRGCGSGLLTRAPPASTAGCAGGRSRGPGRRWPRRSPARRPAWTRPGNPSARPRSGRRRPR